MCTDCCILTILRLRMGRDWDRDQSRTPRSGVTNKMGISNQKSFQLGSLCFNFIKSASIGDICPHVLTWDLVTQGRTCTMDLKNPCPAGPIQASKAGCAAMPHHRSDSGSRFAFVEPSQAYRRYTAPRCLLQARWPWSGQSRMPHLAESHGHLGLFKRSRSTARTAAFPHQNCGNLWPYVCHDMPWSLRRDWGWSGAGCPTEHGEWAQGPQQAFNPSFVCHHVPCQVLVVRASRCLDPRSFTRDAQKGSESSFDSICSGQQRDWLQDFGVAIALPLWPIQRGYQDIQRDNLWY